VARVARDGEAISAGADSGGGGVASSFDGECGRGLFADGAGAAESGGVSGRVWGDSGGGVAGGVGRVAGGGGARGGCSRDSSNCGSGVGSSSCARRTAEGGCPHMLLCRIFLLPAFR
jgi:hypothetical protein